MGRGGGKKGGGGDGRGRQTGSKENIKGMGGWGLLFIDVMRRALVCAAARQRSPPRRQRLAAHANAQKPTGPQARLPQGHRATGHRMWESARGKVPGRRLARTSGPLTVAPPDNPPLSATPRLRLPGYCAGPRSCPNQQFRCLLQACRFAVLRCTCARQAPPPSSRQALHRAAAT